MSDSNRRNKITVIGWVGFLTVIIFFVGWTWIELETEQSVSEHYTRQAEASIRPEDVHLACDGLAPDAITECVIKKYEEHEKWDKDRRDLHAQEDMAFWAMWMLILTGLALIALIATLFQTRRAADYTEGMLDEAKKTTSAAFLTVKEAEKSTDAALANLEETKRSARLQNKPYIVCESAECFITATQITIFITVRNDGNTPTMKMTAGGVWMKYIEYTDENGVFQHDYGNQPIMGQMVEQVGARETKVVTISENWETHLAASHQRRISEEDYAVKIEISMGWSDVWGEGDNVTFSLQPTNRQSPADVWKGGEVIKEASLHPHFFTQKHTKG